MRKIFGYKMLGTLLQSLANSCFKADEQQRNGEKVTACGMSDDDIETLLPGHTPEYAQPDDERRGSKGQALCKRCNAQQNGQARRNTERRVQEARTHTILEEVGYSSLHKTQERQVKRLLFFCFHFFPIL